MTPQALVRLEKKLAEPASKWTKEDEPFVTRITGGKTYTTEERAVIEAAALVQSFQHRQDLLRDSLSVAQVAKVLGVSRQTPHDRAAAGTLLAVLDKGSWKFPSWQFDADGPNAIVVGLPEVLRALDASPLAKVGWLSRPNRTWDGKTPLQALKEGKLEGVINEARTVGVS